MSQASRTTGLRWMVVTGATVLWPSPTNGKAQTTAAGSPTGRADQAVVLRSITKIREQSAGDALLSVRPYNGTATTGTTTLNAVATGKKFTRAAGSFLDDGFEPGQIVTAAGFALGNNSGQHLVLTVDATNLAVETVLTDETGGGDEVITLDAYFSTEWKAAAETREQQFDIRLPTGMSFNLSSGTDAEFLIAYELLTSI